MGLKSVDMLNCCTENTEPSGIVKTEALELLLGVPAYETKYLVTDIFQFISTQKAFAWSQMKVLELAIRGRFLCLHPCLFCVTHCATH